MYLSARMEIHRLLGVPIGQGRVQKAALYSMWLVEGLPPSDGDQGSPPHCSELHRPQCSGCALVFWSSLCLTRCEVNQAVVLSLVFLKGLRHKGEQCSSFCCWGLVAVGCRSSLPTSPPSLVQLVDLTEVKHRHAKPAQLTQLNPSALIRWPPG